MSLQLFILYHGNMPFPPNYFIGCSFGFLKTFTILFCSSSTELRASQIKNSRLSMLWIFFDRSVLQGWIWLWLNFRKWHRASSSKLRLNSKCWLTRWIWNEVTYYLCSGCKSHMRWKKCWGFVLVLVFLPVINRHLPFFGSFLNSEVNLCKYLVVKY